MLQRFVPGLLGILVCAPFVSAQKLTVTAGPLQVGQTIEITYSNPALANGEIVVTIDSGPGPNAERIEVSIKLDAGGKGSTTWTVPDWWQAHFNVDGAKEVTRAID